MKIEKDFLDKLEYHLIHLGLRDCTKYNKIISDANKRIFEIKEIMINERDHSLYEMLNSLEISGKGAKEFVFLCRIPAMKLCFPNAEIDGHSTAQIESFNAFCELYKNYKDKKGDISAWADMMGYSDFFKKIDQKIKGE